MSFGTIANYNAAATLQGGKANPAQVGTTGQDATVQAFNTQMRMAQSLFGEGSKVYGEGSSTNSFDTSMINDSMMFEALATISRLMQNEAGLPQRMPARQTVSQLNQETIATKQQQPMPDVGALSAKFESGSGGVATIGYDRVGGTSYGKYQIASKPGTMDRFLTHLDKENPEWAQRLRDAGPANTGSKQGDMPTVWQQIAKENPAAFEKAQHAFISKETYDPARNMILKQTGLDFNNAPSALREVLWSTSVQHGPTGAARIFGKVIDKFVGNVGNGEFNSKLIEGVYDTRKGQFGSSTQRVQSAVANRLNEEKQLALNMLGHTPLNKIV